MKLQLKTDQELIRMFLEGKQTGLEEFLLGRRPFSRYVYQSN